MKETKKEKKAYETGWNEGYDKGYKRAESYNEDFPIGVLFGIAIGATVLGTVTLLVHIGDSIDTVDVKRFGEIACNEHNLSYSHRTWSEEDKNVPVIHCTANERILDGIIVRG